MHSYKISEEESKRIDILKFIAIIFVVFIHSYATAVNFSSGQVAVEHPIWLDIIEYGISQIIACCGVPMFFIISSILLFRRKRDYLPTLAQKARTLLVPYIIWNSVWILIFFILQSLPFTAEYFSGNNTPIKDCNIIEWLNLFGIGAPIPIDYPLWFVRDLMIITLIFPLINYLTEKFPKVILVITTLMLFVPWDHSLYTAFTWTLLGACIVKLNFRISSIDKISLKGILATYCISLVLILVLYRNSIVWHSISTLFILLGIVFWTRLSKVIYDNIKVRTVFLKLAQWTFIIYVAHEMTLSCMKKVCFKLLPTTAPVLLIEYILIPFFVIGLCIILGIILKKLFPKVFAICTGGRL